MASILVKMSTASTNVDSYNRHAVSGSDTNINNGYVFRLDTKSGSSGFEECWDVSAPSASGSTLNELWMACDAESVVTTQGTGSTQKQYKGLNPDIRDFTNLGGKAFSAFKLIPGDQIKLTADDISGSPSAGSYLNPVSGSYILAFGASATASALNLKLIRETYHSIGSGNIDNQRVLAYELEVIAN